ncbi:MAG: type II toxin-antitoxin system VapC family toxin [Anaerolineae bacterium]|nr:type II toxin-antitoxin system VapC family toxin [Anaerolineae bacterium]
MKRPIREIIQSQQQANAIHLLSITTEHIFELSELPEIHRDPFDRLLIAQARHEEITLVTSDGTIQQYPVRYLWR